MNENEKELLNAQCDLLREIFKEYAPKDISQHQALLNTMHHWRCVAATNILPCFIERCNFTNPDVAAQESVIYAETLVKLLFKDEIKDNF